MCFLTAYVFGSNTYKRNKLNEKVVTFSRGEYSRLIHLEVALDLSEGRRFLSKIQQQQKREREKKVSLIKIVLNSKMVIFGEMLDFECLRVHCKEK